MTLAYHPWLSSSLPALRFLSILTLFLHGAGHPYSCPDIFVLPNSSVFVITSLYDNYVLGAMPMSAQFHPLPPFSETKALPMSSGGVSIMKSGGVHAPPD